MLWHIIRPKIEYTLNMIYSMKREASRLLTCVDKSITSGLLIVENILRICRSSPTIIIGRTHKPLAVQRALSYVILPLSIHILSYKER